MLNVVGQTRQLLADALELPVYVNVPQDRPDEFVVINRGGGAWENDLIDRAGLNIYSYAPTEGEAYSIMERVCSIIRKLPFEAGYCTLDMESLYSDYDITTKQHRWYSNWTVKTYKPKE